MDFSLTPDQESVRDAVQRICAGFDDDYWLERDSTGNFPEGFYRAIADGGWLGIAMPEQYGGANMGATEAALMMHSVAKSSGAMSAASAIHINIFGPHPIVVFGTDEQKQNWLPDLIQGKSKSCFGVTEPDAGLNTTSIKTRADRTATGYVINGKKIWTSTAQVADKIMLLVRTTPKEKCKRTTDGMTLFYTDLNRDYCEVRRIPKMGRAAVDSNEVFIDGLPVPAEDRIGEEGKGFKYLLHSLNPERILIGAEAIGIGQNALHRATEYAKDREVFDRPIGQNQSIQHPLAQSWMELEAAFLMTMKAASLYDNGVPCGIEANAAKYLAAEAGFQSCTRAVMTHGGMGYAKEFHVERLMREVMILRIAPVSPQLILCNIAEKALNLPKSY
ncbi:MAG: acyl-CoA dehydrogenase [Woeseia sp.]|nr:acyl-CoA dehydrogenase [Woeseia sp.]|tara:strand:+ start:240 stop:1406 length:1167 start_codon:yes stop_codon:yes gene_type:complete